MKNNTGKREVKWTLSVGNGIGGENLLSGTIYVYNTMSLNDIQNAAAREAFGKCKVAWKLVDIEESEEESE